MYTFSNPRALGTRTLVDAACVTARVGWIEPKPTFTLKQFQNCRKKTRNPRVAHPFKHKSPSCELATQTLRRAGLGCRLAKNGHAMPISYEVDKQRRLVVCTASGVVTAGDVMEFHERIVKDNDFNSSFSQLVDCTAITKTNISPKGMRALAEESSFSTDSRRAFVADSPLGFGLSRVYEIVRSLQGDKHIRVFRNRADALTWLLAEKDENDATA